MKNETPEERNKRFAVWMGRVTAHFDSPQIRKEGEAAFEKANPIKK